MNSTTRFVCAAAALLAAGCQSTPPMLTGRVLDGQGRPLDDVEVRVYGGIATRWQTGATRTASDGTFAFDEVTGALHIPDDNADWQQYVGVCAGATVDGLNPAAYLPWKDVTIPPGGTCHVELVLDADEVAARIQQERAR